VYNIQEGEQYHTAQQLLSSIQTSQHYRMSSIRSNMMADANAVDNGDVVVDVDVDVEKESEQNDGEYGLIPSNRAGDQKAPAKTKQEEGAVGKVHEDYKDEETIEAGKMKTTPRDVARRRKIKEADGNTGSAGARSDDRAEVSSGAAGSEYMDDDIDSLSSSVRPGAYRIGPHSDDEDEITRTSTFVQSRALPGQQQQYQVQGIDLEALVDSEAARVLQQEREQQPVIEVVAQGDKGLFDSPGQENDGYWVFGFPKWCIKWLFLGTVMVLVVAAIYFVARPKPPKIAPTAAPTMAVTSRDPIDTIIDMLRDYVPDIASVSSFPNSTEYRAVEWLARNNYSSSLSQGYAMLVMYLETGGDTGLWYNSSLWLSEEPICEWYGVGCNGTNITSLNLGKFGELLDTVTLVKQHDTARTDH
jgi:hypothetical protein